MPLLRRRARPRVGARSWPSRRERSSGCVPRRRVPTAVSPCCGRRSASSARPSRRTSDSVRAEPPDGKQERPPVFGAVDVEGLVAIDEACPSRERPARARLQIATRHQEVVLRVEPGEEGLRDLARLAGGGAGRACLRRAPSSSIATAMTVVATKAKNRAAAFMSTSRFWRNRSPRTVLACVSGCPSPDRRYRTDLAALFLEPASTSDGWCRYITGGAPQGPSARPGRVRRGGPRRPAALRRQGRRSRSTAGSTSPSSRSVPVLRPALRSHLTIAGARQRDGHAVLVGSAFCVMAALLCLHGLATPGVLVGMNGVVAFTGGATLPVGAAILALGVVPALRRPAAVRPLLALPRRRGRAHPRPRHRRPPRAESRAAGPRAPQPARARRARRRHDVLRAALLAGPAHVPPHPSAGRPHRRGRHRLARERACRLRCSSPGGTSAGGSGTGSRSSASRSSEFPSLSTCGEESPARARSLGDLRGADLVAEEEAFLGSHVRALLVDLVEKDEYTEEHTRRVALRAVQVGDELGLGPSGFATLPSAVSCTTSAS